MALGVMPSAELLSHISSFNATSPLASSAPSSSAGPTTLSWSCHGQCRILPRGLWELTPYLPPSWRHCCQGFCSSKQVQVIEFPMALDCLQSLASCLRKCIAGSTLTWQNCCHKTSTHDPATPEVDPHRFVLYPGCEFIKPKKCNIEAITEMVKAFAMYMAAMGKKFPEAMPEILAYQQVSVNASEQYDGIYWRCYDTHYRVNTAATGNRQWSDLDIDLYTQVFTGRAQTVASCAFCNSTSHNTKQCPLKPCICSSSIHFLFDSLCQQVWDS